MAEKGWIAKTRVDPIGLRTDEVDDDGTKYVPRADRRCGDRQP